MNALNNAYARRDSGNAQYEEIVGAVMSHFDEVVGSLQGAHEALYRFLGFIYESAATIDNQFGMRGLLVSEVSRLINFGSTRKRRWNADKHDTFDLLLTLRTGLSPDLASSKSGWLAALRAASERKDDDGNLAPVERTEEKFVEWIKPIGVSGARKLARPTSGFNLCEFAEGIEVDSAAFELDLPNDAEPPEGMMAILGRVLSRENGKAKIALVEVILDEKRVKSLTSWTAKRWEKDTKAYARRFTSAAKKAIQKEYGDPSEPDIPADPTLVTGEFLQEVEKSL